MTLSSSLTTDSAMFNPINLEASIGRIEDHTINERACEAEQVSRSSPSSYFSSSQHLKNAIHIPTTKSRTGITRTSSRTPFQTEAAANTSARSDSSNSLLPQPYPISETDHEIKERMRLTESVDWSNSLVIANSPPKNTESVIIEATENADQQSMMEVTVDDFVLSAEEANSLTDLDTATIQDDPNGFWDTPAQVASTMSVDRDVVDMTTAVPFSVTISSQENAFMMDENEDGILVEGEDADASPIRSSDMEW